MQTLFALLVTAFIAIGAFQFSQAWPDAQRGLLLYEKTCPLNQIK